MITITISIYNITDMNGNYEQYMKGSMTKRGMIQIKNVPVNLTQCSNI